MRVKLSSWYLNGNPQLLEYLAKACCILQISWNYRSEAPRKVQILDFMFLAQGFLFYEFTPQVTPFILVFILQSSPCQFFLLYS